MAVNALTPGTEALFDGKGISSLSHTGVGLTSMRERAVELGGTCTRARELFPLLTGSSFNDLAIASGANDELAIVGRRGDEEVPVHAMSDGERHTLYRALRVALQQCEITRSMTP